MDDKQQINPTSPQPLNWILLRGLGRESRHWLKFPKLLSEATGGEVHCLDLAGFGTESLQVPPITVQANADEVRGRFLQLSGGKGRWACLGHSMGGMVALDWAKRYPRDFERLVLINTSSKDVGAFHHRISIFGIYCLLRASFSENGLERERQILKMISNLKANDEATLSKKAAIADTAPISLDKLMRQVFAASQFVAPKHIEIPILMLASLKDKMVDVRCSKQLAERYKARVKFHPAAGHDLTLDDPNWVAERIKEYLEECRE